MCVVVSTYLKEINMILTDDERKEIKNELIESIVEQWGSNGKFDCLDTALKSAMPMIVR